MGCFCRRQDDNNIFWGGQIWCLQIILQSNNCITNFKSKAWIEAECLNWFLKKSSPKSERVEKSMSQQNSNWAYNLRLISFSSILTFLATTDQ